MSLSGKQKKYLKKHFKKESIDKMAANLGISVEEIEIYIKKRWGEEKYQKLITRDEKPGEDNLEKRVLFFNFKTWLKKNKKTLGFLTLLVFVAYVNTLTNEFVSDDIGTILNSKRLDNFNYILIDFPVFLRSIFYFFINKLFGRNPLFYRLVNIFFHLGSVLTVYLLLYLLYNFRVGLLAASLLAVHPLMTEAITWISGGPYSQYSFFLLFSLLMFILSYKGKKFFIISLISFFLALFSSEKAIVFPLALLLFLIAWGKLAENWKKLIAPFIIGGSWALIYISKIPQRLTNLQTVHYQEPTILNPLFQIPVAIASYLELVFWPKGLTLYHSEMLFTKMEYLFKLVILITFLGIIVYTFKRHRQIFFWLCFFIISLLPTLTPLGISWIVAERYVYLGAIGIFVALALVSQKLTKTKELRTISSILFGLLIFGLLVRTIVRNADWKNQDKLWLAAAKTSPSSPQNHNNLGDLYGRQGDLNRAVEEFKKAIVLKPGYADAYHNLANTYLQMGEINLAIENFQKAIEFNPNLWQSYQTLGGIFFNLKKFSQSEDYLKKAIKVNPQNPTLHANLAAIYFKQEKIEEAKRELEVVLQLDPQNQAAQSLLLQLTEQ